MSATATARPERRAEARPFPVAEIFGPTIQGEGALIGRPTLFVRFGGCDSACTWCDSKHAVDAKTYKHTWEPLTATEILARLTERALGAPMLVTLSGGNPALHPLGPLVALGQARGFTFAAETQGTVWPVWFAQLDHLIVSPKPPSSDERPDLFALEVGLAKMPGHVQTSLKVVVMDAATDMSFAGRVRLLAQRLRLPMYLSVGNPDVTVYARLDDQREHRDELLRRYARLCHDVLDLGWHEVTVLPQLHVLTWGNQKGV